MRLRLPLTAAMFAIFALSTSLGCAVASEELDDAGPGKKKDTGSSSDDTGDESDDSATTDDSSSSTDSATSTDSASTDDSATTDSGSTAETGTPCTVLGTSDCMSATDLGSVSGDTGSGVKTATGTDNQFLKVKVTEDDSSLLSSKDLKVRITLSSTDPANFDLYVYLGPVKAAGLECSSVKDYSTVTGSDDVVEETWTDNHPIGGSDDTRWVTIEVRHATPTCTGASWSLKVEGNK